MIPKAITLLGTSIISSLFYYYCILNFILILFLLLFVWSMPHTMWDLSSLEGIEPLSLQWDHRVLNTGPPGNSLEKGNPTNQISPHLNMNLPSTVLCQYRNQTYPLKLKYKPDQVLPLFLGPTGVFHFLQRKSRSPYNGLQILYSLTWSPCCVIYSAPRVFTFSLFLEHTSHTFIFISSSFSPELSFIGGYCLTLLSFWYSVGWISHPLLIFAYYVWSSPFYLRQHSTPLSFTFLTSSYLFISPSYLFGEGNGNTLQYSCLKNSMYGGDLYAIVHGVTKSWTQRSNFTFTFMLITFCTFTYFYCLLLLCLRM